MPFTQPLPEWLKAGTKPPQSKITGGWEPSDKPPADWWNWFQYTTFKALEELKTHAVHSERIGVNIPTLEDGKIPASQLNIETTPDASTTVKGISMLDDSPTSASTTKAATPRIVKLVSDKVGDTTGLQTTAKGDTVLAINELVNRIKLRGTSTLNSTTGRVISHSIGNLNYVVFVTPSANSNGNLGELWVEKSATSFKVLCSGSSTVSFDYVVILL